MAEALSLTSHTFSEAQHCQPSMPTLVALPGFASHWQELEGQAAFLPELILPTAPTGDTSSYSIPSCLELIRKRIRLIAMQILK